MLFRNGSVKAEHRCRMDAMRHQPKQTSGRVGRTARPVVVATLLSVALAACGVPTAAGIAVSPGIAVQNRVFHDQAPTWQPNERLLREIMSSSVSSTEVVIPAIEFGGMAAPSWEPNYSRLETLLGAEPTSGPR